MAGLRKGTIYLTDQSIPQTPTANHKALYTLPTGVFVKDSSGNSVRLDDYDLIQSISGSLSYAISASYVSIYQGTLPVSTSGNIVSVIHSPINLSTTYPVVSLLCPSNDSIIYPLSVLSRTTTGFNIGLGGVPDQSGYFVDWFMAIGGASVTGNSSGSSIQDVTTITSSADNILISQIGSNYNLNVRDYISNSTVASLTGSLQYQIDNLPALSGSGSTGGIYGIESIPYNTDFVRITHPYTPLTVPPIISLSIPVSGDMLSVLGVTNLTTGSFDVILSNVTVLTGYKINWAMPFASEQQSITGDYVLTSTVAGLTGNLQEQINLKASDLDVVHLSLNESISGTKTFVTNITSPRGTGTGNEGFGNDSLISNSLGVNNTALGSYSLYNNTEGNFNTAIGYGALYFNTIGSNNVAIGYNSGLNENGSNKLYIDNAAGTSGTALIYGDFLTGELYNKGNRILTQVDGNTYTLLSTTALLTGNLQEQINNLPALSGSGSTGGIYGIESIPYNTDFVRVTHPYTPLTVPPLISLSIPASGDILSILGVTNITTDSFDVILSNVTDLTGYKINWAMPFASEQQFVDSDYTLLATTALLTSNLQYQIDNLQSSPSGSAATQIARVLGSTSSPYGYVEDLPSGYEEASGDLRPLVLFLHGAGEQGPGTNAVDLMNAIASNNSPHEMIRAGTELGRRFSTENAICLGPQSPTWWDVPTIHQFIEYAFIAYPSIDRSRVYIVAPSMGGAGTWGYLAAHGGNIAAAIPCCAASTATDATLAVGVAVWAFHAWDDPVTPLSNSVSWSNELARRVAGLPSPTNMMANYPYGDGSSTVAATNQTGEFTGGVWTWTAGVNSSIPKSPRLTIYTSGGHDGGWSPAVMNSQVWDWLFSQRRQTTNLETSSTEDGTSGGAAINAPNGGISCKKNAWIGGTLNALSIVAGGGPVSSFGNLNGAHYGQNCENLNAGSLAFTALSATSNAGTCLMGKASLAFNVFPNCEGKAFFFDSTGIAFLGSPVTVDSLLAETVHGVSFQTSISGNNERFGLDALHSLTTGQLNTAVGYQSLTANTAGDNNTAVGRSALQNNETGSFNTAVGVSAMEQGTAGSYNTAIGAFAGFTGGGTNSTAIGHNATVTLSNQVVLGDENITSTILRGLTQPLRTITNSNDPGAPGEICWDSSYIYVCVASNSWKRVELLSW
jgi:poly(3-hydroxybutyrate) depolymerase